MKLSPEQQNTVKSWITAGASIADVQKRINEEFKISLTFRDTRFLIDDLGLDIKAPPPPKPAAPNAAVAATTPPPIPGANPATPGEAELVDDDAGFEDDAAGFPPEPAPAGAAASSVKVEVDRITRPGTVVSGSVTFSDGKSGKWALDQVGRLMFESAPPGYRPSPADLQQFQRELSTLLQRQGY